MTEKSTTEHEAEHEIERAPTPIKDEDQGHILRWGLLAILILFVVAYILKFSAGCGGGDINCP